MTVKEVLSSSFINKRTKITIIGRSMIVGGKGDNRIASVAGAPVRAFAVNPNKNRCKIVLV